MASSALTREKTKLPGGDEMLEPRKRLIGEPLGEGISIGKEVLGEPAKNVGVSDPSLGARNRGGASDGAAVAFQCEVAKTFPRHKTAQTILIHMDSRPEIRSVGSKERKTLFWLL